MQIGNLTIEDKYPLLLAPMEDVSDLAFRQLCRGFGASMVYTEFVSADALIRHVPGALRKITITEQERPSAIQIYGRDPDTMAEAAAIACQSDPDVLDLNFGCPVKRVAGKGAGSGLLQDIPRLLAITRKVVEASSRPVTVKTRLGWDHNQIIIEDLALALQDCGIQALTIHGRTRSDMYKGKSDWSYIGRVKNNPQIHIPIIGNGDITTGQEAREAFERYGVDAVMVGRATIGQPWIFAEMKSVVEGQDATPLSPHHQMEILKSLVRSNIDKIDPYRGILHSRRHLAASPIFKGIPNFRETRIRMLQATTPESLFQILDEIEELFA